MNRLSGKITRLTSSGDMTLVDVDVNGIMMMAITIGAPGRVNYLRESGNIELVFNESEVSIGKTTCRDISLSNQLDCVIEAIVPGKLFTQVRLLFRENNITSLIATRSVERLNLKTGDNVVAFIKTNEIFLKGRDRESNAD